MPTYETLLLWVMVNICKQITNFDEHSELVLKYRVCQGFGQAKLG